MYSVINTICKVCSYRSFLALIVFLCSSLDTGLLVGMLISLEIRLLPRCGSNRFSKQASFSSTCKAALDNSSATGSIVSDFQALAFVEAVGLLMSLQCLLLYYITLHHITSSQPRLLTGEVPHVHRYDDLVDSALTAGPASIESCVFLLSVQDHQRPGGGARTN